MINVTKMQTIRFEHNRPVNLEGYIVLGMMALPLVAPEQGEYCIDLRTLEEDKLPFTEGITRFDYAWLSVNNNVFLAHRGFHTIPDHRMEFDAERALRRLYVLHEKRTISTRGYIGKGVQFYKKHGSIWTTESTEGRSRVLVPVYSATQR
ncbi:hypothetical protein HYX12_00115 [Candidatus Woesearchaeota archaeon]|nr:hypothetical protein [Candidatus Woesearchaeota archaeon]